MFHPMKSGLGFVLASLYISHSVDQVLVYVFLTENVMKIMAMKIDITVVLGGFWQQGAWKYFMC